MIKDATELTEVTGSRDYTVRPGSNQLNTRAKLTVEELAIKRAQKGDGEAFGQLYSRHRGRVYALCLRMTRGNVTLAEELTQDAFLAR